MSQFCQIIFPSYLQNPLLAGLEGGCFRVRPLLTDPLQQGHISMLLPLTYLQGCNGREEAVATSVTSEFGLSVLQ